MQKSRFDRILRTEGVDLYAIALSAVPEAIAFLVEYLQIPLPQRFEPNLSQQVHQSQWKIFHWQPLEQHLAIAYQLHQWQRLV
ncbi:hypothetical protein [Coleofasciculus sp.]|uniref:hypothetical protein n=1 Tax=Coleofasciculus sp. TaxID=3100458 RepID=UPI0039FA7619